MASAAPVTSGGHSESEPPLPISNRAVKRFSADDSMLFACESRSPPGFLYKSPATKVVGVFYCLLEPPLYVVKKFPKNGIFRYCIKYKEIACIYKLDILYYA